MQTHLFLNIVPAVQSMHFCMGFSNMNSYAVNGATYIAEMSNLSI